ncbi:MAG: hypothetical protein ACLQU1_24355 [Bryobacteraceae bacterium]
MGVVGVVGEERPMFLPSTAERLRAAGVPPGPAKAARSSQHSRKRDSTDPNSAGAAGSRFG